MFRGFKVFGFLRVHGLSGLLRFWVYKASRVWGGLRSWVYRGSRASRL